MLRSIVWFALIGLLLSVHPQQGAAQDNPWRVPGAAQPGYGQQGYGWQYQGGYAGQQGNHSGYQGGYAGQQQGYSVQGGYAGQQGSYSGQGGSYYGWNSSQPIQPPHQPAAQAPQQRTEWPGYAALGGDGNTMMDAPRAPPVGTYPAAPETQQGGQGRYAAVPQNGAGQRYYAPPQPQQAPLMLGDFAPLDRDVTQETPEQRSGYGSHQARQTPSWSRHYNAGAGTGQTYAPQPQMQQQAPAPAANPPQTGQGGYAYGYGNSGSQGGYGSYGGYGGNHGDPAFGGPSTMNSPYPSGGYGFPYGTGVPGPYGW